MRSRVYAIPFLEQTARPRVGTGLPARGGAALTSEAQDATVHARSPLAYDGGGRRKRCSYPREEGDNANALFSRSSLHVTCVNVFPNPALLRLNKEDPAK